MDEKEKGQNPITAKKGNGGFWLVMKWTGVLMIVFIAFGFLLRIISPVELHLDEDEFIERVFVEFESEVWDSPDAEARLIGSFDGGSILYVVAEDSQRVLVRPFAISHLDSVWIDRNSVIYYTPDAYRKWHDEEERRKFDLD